MKNKQSGKKEITTKIVESIKGVLAEQNEGAAKKVKKSTEKLAKKLAKKFSKLLKKAEKKQSKKTKKGKNKANQNKQGKAIRMEPVQAIRSVEPATVEKAPVSTAASPAQKVMPVNASKAASDNQGTGNRNANRRGGRRAAGRPAASKTSTEEQKPE